VLPFAVSLGAFPIPKVQVFVDVDKLAQKNGIPSLSLSLFCVRVNSAWFESD
jgi:hypothetical protein